jgi:hypothetical protein
MTDKKLGSASREDPAGAFSLLLLKALHRALVSEVIQLKEAEVQKDVGESTKVENSGLGV